MTVLKFKLRRKPKLVNYRALLQKQMVELREGYADKALDHIQVRNKANLERWLLKRSKQA